jgi:hypothetical protein
MSSSTIMDETGWGHDLGFAKKPMVLSPMEQEQNVYYRASVVSVNRQRRTVSSLKETAGGAGRTAVAHSTPACCSNSTTALKHHRCKHSPATLSIIGQLLLNNTSGSFGGAQTPFLGGANYGTVSSSSSSFLRQSVPVRCAAAMAALLLKLL